MLSCQWTGVLYLFTACIEPKSWLCVCEHWCLETISKFRAYWHRISPGRNSRRPKAIHWTAEASVHPIESPLNVYTGISLLLMFSYFLSSVWGLSAAASKSNGKSVPLPSARMWFTRKLKVRLFRIFSYLITKIRILIVMPVIHYKWCNGNKWSPLTLWKCKWYVWHRIIK